MQTFHSQTVSSIFIRALVLSSLLLAGCLHDRRSSDGPELNATGLPDLRVAGVEVTQGVQNLDNDMPLIAGRATMVRVFVEDLNGKGAKDVTARLQVYRICPGPGCPIDNITLSPGESARPLGELLPLNRDGTIQSKLTRTIDVPEKGFRRNQLGPFGSLWFHLPPEWRNFPGRLKLEVEVNPDNDPAEFRSDNNRFELEIRLLESRPLRIRVVPVHLHDSNSEETLQTCADEGTWRTFSYLYRYLPVATLDVSCRTAPLYPAGHEEGTEWDMSDPEDCIDVLSRLQWLRSQEDLSDSWHYLGLVLPKTIPCNNWRGAAGGKRVSWVSMRERSVETHEAWSGNGRNLAHEIAHNRGSPHVLCAGNEGPPNGTVDPDYPYPAPDCRFSADDPEGFVGADVYFYLWWSTTYSEPRIIPNENVPDEQEARYFPLMGYKSPKWIDPYTYCRILDTLRKPSADFPLACDFQNIDRPPATTSLILASASGTAVRIQNNDTPPLPLNSSSKLLLVSGIVDVGDGAGELQQLALLPSDRVAPHVLAEGRESLAQVSIRGGEARFTLRLLNDDGSVVNEMPVLVERINHPPEDGDRAANGSVSVPDRYAFLEVLAFPDSASVLELYDREQDTVVDFRRRSPNPPTVSLQSPGRNERLATGTMVRWNGRDGDGDALRYLLRYSPDGGQQWHVLRMDLAGNSLELDERLLAGLPGSDQGVLEIVANDGFDTAYAQVTGLRLDDRPPQVQILTPQEGDRFQDDGGRLIFQAQAWDLEDGVLQDEALTWSSDRDGELGQGSQLALDADELRPGTHVLRVTARDSAGHSNSEAVTIEIVALQ